MSLPFRQVVAAVTVVAVAIILAAIPVWKSMASAVDQAHAQYEHSLETLQTALEMMNLIHDAELGYISFAASGDNRYMVIHDRAVLAMPSLLADLVADHHHGEAFELTVGIQNDWARLDELFKSQLGDNQHLVRPGDFEYSSQTFADVASLEHKLNKLQLHEEKELHEADHLQHQKLDQAQTVLGIGLFGFGFLVFLLVYSFKKGLDKDIKALVGHVSEDGHQRQSKFSDPQLASLEEALLKRDNLIKNASLEKLQLSEQHLQQQREFGAVLAHELKTPLTTLIGAIRNARIDGTMCTREAQNHIENNAQTLVDLIDSTLDYNELIQGLYQPKNELVDLHELAQEARESVLKHWNGDKAEIKIEAKFARNKQAHTDKAKVRQVVINFLSNAIKFSPEMGEVKLQMQFDKTEETGKEWLTIEVTDQGIGIGAEDLERIFEPFKQLNSGVNRKFVGTGLGLSLNQEIAKNLHGKIEVQSAPGKGSCFSLKIPVNTEICTVQEISGNPENTGKLDLNGMIALMVEDHPLNGKINAHLFKREFGCKVKIVTTGEAALTTFDKGERFDFVLMDINLGEGINGFETSRALNDLYGEDYPPIIALSAAIREGDEAELEAAGICGSIPKPFTKENAMSILAPILGNKAAGKNVRLIPQAPLRAIDSNQNC